MKNSDLELSDIHLLGEETRYQVVVGDRSDGREWLRDAPGCEALAPYRIAHVGIMDAVEPFRVVRSYQNGTYFMATVSGEGEVLVDGRWQRCRPTTACLLPPFILNGLRAVAGERWGFVWVRYQKQPLDQQPLVSSSSPVMAPYPGAGLKAAVEGLHAETSAGSEAASVHRWVELVQGYVQRFARPFQQDDRLWRLWETVESDLSRKWNLDELAGIAHVSGEHLRRLCRKQLGRSPIQQVTFLRMRRAAEILALGDTKIETVARSVGYENPFAFSNTFKKWIGWRPSEHRSRSGDGDSGDGDSGEGDEVDPR